MKKSSWRFLIIGGAALAVAVFVGSQISHPVNAVTPAADAATQTATSSPTIGIEIQQGGGCSEIPSYNSSYYTDYSVSNANSTDPNPADYAGADGYTGIGPDGRPVYDTDCAAIWLSGTGPFTQDFQIGVRMRNPKQAGGWGPWGWTPWASDIANHTNNTDAEGDVGWSPLVGGVTNIGSDPGHAMYQVAVNTRSLPDPGDTVSIQNVGLQEFDGNNSGHSDYSYSYYCEQKTISAAPFTPVYTSGAGWSSGGKGSNGMYSGVGDVADCTRLYLGSATVMGAIETANNIPATLDVGQKVSAGGDGNTLSITMKNTGSQAWGSSFTTQDTDTPQGTCNYDYSGTGTKDAPASGSADGASCKVTVNLTSKDYSLVHSASSFSMAPESVPIQYTGVTKTTTYHAAQQTTETGTCDFVPYIGRGFCSIDGSDCSGDTCTATRSTGPSWTVSYSGGGYASGIAPGDTFTFPLSSITAPSLSGSFNESWQMEKDGAPFGAPFTTNIKVGSSGDSLTVNSTNIVTGGPVTGSWTVIGPTTLSTDNKTSDTYNSLADGSYTTLPGTAAGYALESVRGGTLALRSGGGVLQKIAAAVGNTFSSIAFADSQPVYAIVCDSTELSQCTDSGSSSGVISLNSASGNGSATEYIKWYPLAQMNVNPDSVALDGSGNGQFSVQNSGSPGSELSWTATTTDSWFTVSPASGSITNSVSEQGSAGATNSITITANPAKLQSGNWTGTVIIQGDSYYCSIEEGCSPFQKSVKVTFSGGTCTGSGCLAPNGPSAPAVSISPATSAITLGQSEKLTIASENADSCIQSGDWSGTTCNGSVTVTPSTAGTFTYKVAAMNANGTSTASAAVTVTESTPPQPTCSITASPTSVVVPQVTTLSYSCDNIQANSCTLSGGAFSNSSFPSSQYSGNVLKGSTTDAPATDTTYTILCYGTGAYSSVTSSANVTVTVTNPGRNETNP